jgi:hypothetical protein
MAARRREAHGVFGLLASNYPFEAGHRLLALLLQRKSAYAEAAESKFRKTSASVARAPPNWRRYLAH